VLLEIATVAKGMVSPLLLSLIVPLIVVCPCITTDDNIRKVKMINLTISDIIIN
jgi:hypothetical protein